MANLGFVGLGLMGSRIVKKFLDAGHSVTGYNRTRDKAQWLIDAGMKWGDSPRAVAEQSDVAFSMVSDSNALAEVGRRNYSRTDRRKNLCGHEHGEPAA